MRIIFVLTALVGLLLLSITLNAVRKGKIFRRLNKRLEGLFFSSTKKFFPEVCSIIFITKIKRLPHFFTQLYIVWRILCATYLSCNHTFFKIMFCERQALFQLPWYHEFYTCALLLALARASTVARDVFNK